MTVAYCIAAHTRPSQCRRLVRRLLDDDPGCLVLLHYDQRVAPLDLAEVVGPRVQILPERPLYWGGPQIVDLFREMLRFSLGSNCSYAVLLSGQDYPLRHVGALEAELSRFDVWPTDMRPLFAGDGTCDRPEGMRRYSYQWWHADDPNLVLRAAFRGTAKLPWVHWSTRDLPLPYLVQAEQLDQLWWGIRSRGPACPSMSVERGSAFPRPPWTQSALRPASWLGSSAMCPRPTKRVFTRPWPTRGLTFAPGEARYVRWEDKDNPELLTGKDLAAITGSGAHFARKFDELVDRSVLDQLDLIGKSGATGK